jgi:2,3-bisphosphoglycerate-independent phosphoglycerate mutase
MNKPLLLLIRDGWGVAPPGPGNAVAAANTPNLDRLLANYPHCVLAASGTAVGVRDGSQGSSEVGHLNMGAGRIVEQEIVRVDNQIASGELFRAPRLRQAVKRCKESGARFHLMGLVQDEGVHAMQDHLFAFLRFLAGQGLAGRQVCVHFFADGRDTPPQSALTFLDQLEAEIAEVGAGVVATVMGRYWAMDRGRNWLRTEAAYRCLTEGAGLRASSARHAVEQAYRRAKDQRAAGEDLVETDEFIRPTAVVDADSQPVGLIRPGDAVLHTNYRQDRALQLTQAFVETDFNEYGFARGPRPDVFYMALTRYYDELACELVPPMNMANLLGEVLGREGLLQLRIAEFQKYRHVTSFFNGKRLEPLSGEDRIEVESITIPEDRKPEMSAVEVTDLVLTAVRDGIAAARAAAQAEPKASLESGEALKGLPADRLAETYDVIVLNYANCDMVGHTGVFEAAVRAVETVDRCVGKVVEAVLARDGCVLVTADHGNAEQMLDPETGATATAHSTNPVELLLISNDAAKRKLVKQGKLADIAVTMLDLLGLEKPEEMTANSLIAE